MLLSCMFHVTSMPKHILALHTYTVIILMYLQVQVSADNAESLVQNLTGLLETDNLADQTSDNLAIVSSVLTNLTNLINMEGFDSSENVCNT